jgi:Tfp pilus assembly protein FimT
MHFRRSAGITLWELMVGLTVGGILLGIAVPNMTEFLRNGDMTGAANQLITATLLARSEALKRQVPVTFCLSDNPTDEVPTCESGTVKDSAARGFIVWVDESGPPTANGAPDLSDASDGDAVYDAGEQLLMQSVAPGGSIRTSANCGYVAYGPNGFSRAVPSLCFPGRRLILLCDERGNRTAYGDESTARLVQIDRPGRGQVIPELTAVTNGIGGNANEQVDATCP